MHLCGKVLLISTSRFLFGSRKARGFPNVFAVLVVYATLGIAGGILGEAGLSYLGLGVKAPQPSWGNMLHMAQNFTALTNYPWLWIPPGVMILSTVLSINVLGDGLRDALDPKLRQ